MSNLKGRYIDGTAYHPLRRTWDNMKTRCYNPHSKEFKYYGARGIKVCDRWRNSFLNFLNDMGEKPPDYTLERIDNNKDYSPENCKWATRSEQNKNRNWNHKGELHFNNKLNNKQVLKIRKLINKYTSREVALMFGVSRETISRIKTRRSWSHI